MALVTSNVTANGIAPQHDQEKLAEELFALQVAITEGRKPQFQLPAATIDQLKANVASAAKSSAIEQPQLSIPGLSYRASASRSGLDPIFLEKSDSLVRAEGQLKRQRIERELHDQVERRKLTYGDRDGVAEVNVDNVLVTAQKLIPPLSGLKVETVDENKDKSSFDENDYYSSQVESVWSDNGLPVAAAASSAGKAFTANSKTLNGSALIAGDAAKNRHLKSTDRLPAPNNDDYEPMMLEEGEDDYIPQEALAGHDINAYNQLGQITPPEDAAAAAAASDYEPGEISQPSEDDEYTPEYVPTAAAIPEPQTHVAHNRLTQIAAPQPNRVSPLAVHKGQNYELELVDGRPEMVRKAKTRRDVDQARQSSASPPVNSSGRPGRRQKGKKRKREAEQQSGSRAKKRDRHAGLDTSAQYPQAAIKVEPVSPPRYVEPQQPRYEYVPVEQPRVNMFPPQQFVPQQAYEQVAFAPMPYGQPLSAPGSIRSSSVMTQRVVQRDDQDLRRVATLHHAQQQPQPVEYRPYSPIGPYMAAARPQTGMSMAPPPSRLQENIPPQSLEAAFTMAPPPAPKRVVVDQHGNRYYAAEPEVSRASIAPESDSLQYDRAPSRMSTFAPPAAQQYDPANARIEYLQPSTRIAAPPSYALEAGDGRMHKMRAQQPQVVDPARYAMEPASPVFEQRVQHEHIMPQRFEGMPPPGMQFVDPSRQLMHPPPHPQFVDPPRQTMAPPSQFYTHEATPMQAGARAYSVQPDFVQQMPMGFPPRQGSVAPVQYIRQSVQPEQNVRYVDARGFEVQPQQIRQVGEYRQY